MEYNLNALRGLGDTDKETREDLLTLYPTMNLPEEYCQTPKFVPQILKEMERINFENLSSGTFNPATGKNFTLDEARDEAANSVAGAHFRYKTLLKAKENHNG